MIFCFCYDCCMPKSKIDDHNKHIFDLVRALNLPFGHYAITSSGPMGARDLREIHDADIIVDDYLWEILARKHKPMQKDGITKIVLSKGLVEILGKGSFFNNYSDTDPDIIHQIKTADILDGLPFVKLDYVRFFKQRSARQKDLIDIEIIDKYINTYGNK